MEAVTPFVPLMQTLVWPLTLLIVTGLFRHHVRRALDVLVERLESGSPFEAGPVKLGAGLSPPTRDERRRKLERELAPVHESSEATITQQREPESVGAAVVSPSVHLSRLEVARFRRIEDAALAKLSEQIGAPITREVKPNRHSPLVFDGVALSDNSYRIVEVRIVRSVSHARGAVRHFLDSVTAFIISLDARTRRFVSVTVVLVVARDFAGDAAAENELVEEADHDDRVPSNE
jgi:hypothetical protein